MRYGSVCSGVEAATVAWHPLGWEPQWFSEIEKFPSAVLQHHYPDVPNYGDMTKFKEWPDDRTIELLVGGTPCQSFSVAGLRKGLADPRGNLMLTYLAIAAQHRPRWLVWENVPGVLSSNRGRDFGTFIGALGKLGYGFAYRVLDAQYFGVAQRRRRVFVVGHSGDWKRAAAVLFERESLSGNPAPSREEGEKVAPSTTGGTGERGEVGYIDSENNGVEPDGVLGTLTAGSPSGGGRPLPAVAIACNEVAPAVTTGPPFSRTGNERVECEAIVPVTARMRGFGDYDCDGTASALKARDYKDATDLVASNLSVRRLTPTECERLQGFPDNYTLVGDKCYDGPRYKALGNSMAVPVMRWIGERIAKVEASSDI